MAPDRPHLIVAGLVLRVGVEGDSGRSAFLGGPALAATAAAAHCGAPSTLLAAVSSSLRPDECAMLRQLAGDAAAVRWLDLAPLEWHGPAIVGDDAGGRITGDPTLWEAPFPPEFLEGKVLVLSNGDPRWYAELLRNASPARVLLDAHGEWFRFREAALAECFRRCALVTITEADHRVLPPALRRELHQPGRIVIIKRGARGISVMDRDQVVQCPPPIQGLPASDISAGDALLGALAAILSAGEYTLDSVERAYRHTYATLQRVLLGSDLSAFLYGPAQAIG